MKSIIMCKSVIEVVCDHTNSQKPNFEWHLGFSSEKCMFETITGKSKIRNMFRKFRKMLHQIVDVALNREAYCIRQ